MREVAASSTQQKRPKLLSKNKSPNTTCFEPPCVPERGVVIGSAWRWEWAGVVAWAEVERWHLPSIEVEGKREPRVLFSSGECRAVVIDLKGDEEMGEHEVRERTVVQVVSGRVAFASEDAEVVCEPGTMVTFSPAERHRVRALEPSRILLLLAPWPGAGHYGEGEDADPERVPANATASPLSS